MRAANKFIQDLENKGFLTQLFRLKVDLYGSLALTGKGHGTDIAILLGFEGYTPAGVDPDKIKDLIAHIRDSKSLNVSSKHPISFYEENDLLFHGDKQLPFHPNGMRFTAYNSHEKEIYSDVIYSVGGGFIVDHASTTLSDNITPNSHSIPYPFDTADQLLEQCTKANMTIAELVMENEKSWRSVQEIKQGLLNVWHVMEACIKRGCHEEGILPGGLNVKRRAAHLYKKLINPNRKKNPAELMEWVSLWALAVNEENAAGGRVVTAPTNGAAGVIPAIINYYLKFTENPTDDGIVTFMLVAGAMGILFKKGASISAAEMGCMGEVGVACSMAAGGLTAALGGSNMQIENATEIGMEHHLGLTCDPIMGLVQIPCIERNTMGAVTAINSMLLALQGDGTHRVSLDQVIATMLQTGRDMQTIYKETSLGGLAVNVPEC
jgi:L-serine dehydratase